MSNKDRKPGLRDLLRDRLGPHPSRDRTGGTAMKSQGQVTSGALERAGTTIIGAAEIGLKLLPDIAKVVERLPYLEGAVGILNSILQIQKV